MRIPRWLRWTVAVLGITVLVLMVCASLWLRSMSPLARCEERRFTVARWSDSVAVRWPQAVRGCLVDDFLRKHELKGRTRGEVLALLGEPRKTDYFKEYELVYWLGPERSIISVDSEWLVIRLDSAGRVSEYGLVTD